MSDGERARIARCDDPESRIMTEQKGGKRDRDAERFQVAGRHGDNESLDFPTSHLIQLMCDRRDMPIMSIVLAWCNDAEGTVDERFKILALKSVEQMPPQMRRQVCNLWQRDESVTHDLPPSSYHSTQPWRKSSRACADPRD